MVGRCSAQTGHAGKSREFGEGRGRGGPRKDLPGPDSGLSGCWGVGDCGDSEKADAGLTPPLPYLSGRVHTPESG